MTIEHVERTTSGLSISRRKVLVTSAWAVPTITLATAAPALAASGDTVVLFTSTFDGIGTALPAGFTVRTGATASAIGTAVSWSTAQVTWNNGTGNARNVASADGLISTSTSAQQNASTDRAVGVRQSGSFGNPGAAFVIDVGPTTNLTTVSVQFKAQSLDVGSGQTTTWTVDAFYGTTRITSGTTFTTGGSTFGSQNVAAVFPATLDNQAQNVFIRIAALDPSTGTGNRATTGIDDMSITAISTI